MGARRTIRRTFDASRFTLRDLDSIREEARAVGLGQRAMVGFNQFYAGGWRVEVIVNGATVTPDPPTPPVCPECRDGKHGNCIGWTLTDDDAVTDCRCPHDS